MQLPERIREAWAQMDGPAVFTTISKEGEANSVYMTSVRLSEDGAITLVDHVLSKTRANILSGSRGVVLFIDKSGKAWQIKGPLSYHKDGPQAEAAKKWAPEQYPFEAAVILTPETAYTGAEEVPLES